MFCTATIIGTFVDILLLIVLAGVVIVGGIGALLSRARGGTLIGGFMRSIVVPPWPLGWLWVWWHTRASSRAFPDMPPSTFGEAPTSSDSSPASEGGHVF